MLLHMNQLHETKFYSPKHLDRMPSVVLSLLLLFSCCGDCHDNSKVLKRSKTVKIVSLSRTQSILLSCVVHMFLPGINAKL